ncbi:MAG: hypothetical protein Q7S60_05285 [bacterium]|nr:hypothetical protein [bacterium]
MAAIKVGGINLLPETLRVPGRLQILSRLLSRGSFVVVGVYIFILMLLLVTSFLFSRQEGALRAKNASLGREVENLRNREGLLAVLKNRARVAQVVFTKAPNVRDNLPTDIINTFSSGTQVSEVVSESGQTGVTAVAPSLEEAKEIFATLPTLGSAQITLTTLSLEPLSGGYSFSLEVK